MLSTIRTLGLIVHMFLISLYYPLNCITFFGSMFTLISFDVIPTKEIYEFIFTISTVKDSYLSD